MAQCNFGSGSHIVTCHELRRHNVHSVACRCVCAIHVAGRRAVGCEVKCSTASWLRSRTSLQRSWCACLAVLVVRHVSLLDTRALLRIIEGVCAHEKFSLILIVHTVPDAPRFTTLTTSPLERAVSSFGTRFAGSPMQLPLYTEVPLLLQCARVAGRRNMCEPAALCCVFYVWRSSLRIIVRRSRSRCQTLRRRRHLSSSSSLELESSAPAARASCCSPSSIASESGRVEQLREQPLLHRRRVCHRLQHGLSN